MKKLWVSFLVFFPLIAAAQRATIREETVAMKTYMYSDPDPVPNIGIIYPWFRFDGFTNHPEQREYKMVILENPWVKVYVMPEVGGKIWGAVEKSTGGAFLYYNHVVKFRDVGMRGPWTSGGLEFNFGAIGHVPTGASPIDYTLKENADGSVSCTVGAIDLPSRTRWNVEIRLEKDKAYVETRATWVNTSPLATGYYHWMNAAAKVAGNLHFIYPGDHYVGHGGEVGTWPVEDGHDLSWYRNNTFGGSKSYHVVNAYANFFGGYWMEDGFGFGHMSTYDDKPGKKLWIWALSRQGMIWEGLLSDSDGQYIEFQSGKLFNQAAYSSTFTPFKHKIFPPYDADVMTERWFPIVGTGGMMAASQYGVMNVEERDGKKVVKISALQALKDTLTVTAGGEVVAEKVLTLDPLLLDSLSFDLPAGEQYKITLGGHKLTYSSAPEDRYVDRPLEPNPDFNWESAYGHYVKGFEAEKQRRYEEALREYDLSLEKEKAFSPALNRKALLLFRRMEYEGAKELAKRSLAVNTYDPLANYVYGLSCDKLGETANARSGFSIAAGDVAYRSAAYTELARSYFRENDLATSLHYAVKATGYNRFNIPAYELLAMIYRKSDRHADAEAVLEKLSLLDPTLHFTGFEKYLSGGETKEDLQASFRNELPVQYYTELALWYHDLGCEKEAGEVLRLAPEDPLIFLWRAKTDAGERDAWLQKVLDAPVKMVFPYRAETAEILEQFVRMKDHWKLKYYLGLIYWNVGRDADARKLFDACGEAPDEAVFWLAKAKLFSDDDAVVLQSVKKATALDPGSWRAALAYIRYMTDHDKPAEVIRLAEKFVKKYPEQPALGLAYAKALIRAGEYRKTIQFLDKYIVLPFEGAVAGRMLYHEACLRAGLSDLEKKKYTSAVTYLQKAKEWPENLGAGKPYDVDERAEDYLTGIAYERQGKKKEMTAWYRKAAGYQKPEKLRENSKLIFQLLALKKLGREEEAKTLLEEYLKKSPDNPYLQWVSAVYRAEMDEAGKIADKLLGMSSGENPYDISYRDRDFEMSVYIVSVLSKAGK